MAFQNFVARMITYVNFCSRNLKSVKVGLSALLMFFCRFYPRIKIISEIDTLIDV